MGVKGKLKGKNGGRAKALGCRAGALCRTSNINHRVGGGSSGGGRKVVNNQGRACSMRSEHLVFEPNHARAVGRDLDSEYHLVT